MLNNPYESPQEVSPALNAPAKPVSSAVVWRNVCIAAICLAPVFWLTFILVPDNQQLSSYLSISQRDTIDDIARCLTMASLTTAAVTGGAWLLAAIRARVE